MKKYQIGLDFGTYQSKVCIFDTENNFHEFFIFPTNNSFFLPSRVAEKEDGTFEYGAEVSGKAKKEYYYFKMAAAEDAEFREETQTETNSISANLYNVDEFSPYSPEFLVSLYITYILFTVKEHYNKKLSVSAKKGSFVSRLFDTQKSKTDQVQMIVRLGIPTEWSHKKNLERKRKFENILFISDHLQLKYKTLNHFLEQKASDLIQEVKNYNSSVRYNSYEEFLQNLDTSGFSVYPETAAGLLFITSTDQLSKGYYAIMDIGGGTTDISFFRLTEKGVIYYLASESYMMAANNVYKQLIDNSKSIKELHEKESKIKNNITEDSIKNNDELRKAIMKVRNELGKLLRKLFMKRVYGYDRGRMLPKYNSQPLIIYGGGLGIHGIIITPLSIYNFGEQNYHEKMASIEMEVVSVEKFTSNIKNILPADKSWQKDFHMLVVALGLSFVKPPNSKDWFDDEEYKPEDIGGRPKSVIAGGSLATEAHPFNEDCYIYNVLLSKWK